MEDLTEKLYSREPLGDRKIVQGLFYINPDINDDRSSLEIFENISAQLLEEGVEFEAVFIYRGNSVFTFGVDDLKTVLGELNFLSKMICKQKDCECNDIVAVE